MPVVFHEGERYVLRWPPEVDQVIRELMAEFGDWHWVKHENGRRRVWRVKWKKAHATGKLPPWCTLSVFRTRGKELRRTRIPSKRNTEQDYHRYYHRRSKIYRRIHRDERVVWTKKQQSLLLYLVRLKKYRRGTQLTNWKGLAKDPRVALLPERYHNNVLLLRDYYRSYLAHERNTPKDRPWNRDHAEKMLANSRRNKLKRKETINSFLQEKLERGDS